MNNNYRMALTEVNEILKYTDDNMVCRIPKKFISFVAENMDTSYKFKVQENVELFDQPIRSETKTILAMIYKDYFCDEIERQELIETDKVQKDLEEKINYEKYNPENVFKNKKTQSNVDNKNTALVDIKQKSFWQKMLEKIKKIFKIK